MGKVKLNLCALCLVSLTAGAAGAGVDSPPAASHEPLSVVHHPEQSGSVEARWQWALAQTPTQSRAEHVWIGFSTRRLMPENSFVGRWPVGRDCPTLSELVYGVRVELPRLSYSRQKTARTVAKEVAYLFEVARASGRIEQAQTSDISLSVCPMRGVLFWLGEVGSEQATALFLSLYRRADDDGLKIQLVTHVAEAQHEQALAFLDEVLQQDKSQRVRRGAVHELERYENQKSLELLLRTVRQDSSEAVRREAVGTMSRLEAPGVEDALMEIAKAGPSPGVQRAAIHVLSERISPAVVACLGSIIDNQNQPRENQRAALEALARGEGAEALDMLIRIAQTHSRVSIRRRALEDFRRFEGGSGGSPAILPCLVDLINKKEEVEEIRRAALDQLAEYGTKEARDALTQVAAAHADPRMRESAIDKLGDMEEGRPGAPPEVTACLTGVINNRREQERIQRKALEVLTRARDEKARTLLLQTATTHANPRIRQAAIDELGRTEEFDVQALPAIRAGLEAIIDNPKEQEAVQRQALDTLKDIEHPDVLAYLKKAGASHPNRNIRRQAQELLAQEMAESWNHEK